MRRSWRSTPAQAQLKSVQAQLVQAQAALNQTRVNLEHAMIEAPIDGIVIERSVDVGQTVAASLQSPTIFKIAADMTKMQVSASIDESDIGRIAPRTARDLHGRCLSGRIVHRHDDAGAPAADRGSERHHLQRDHRRAQPGAEAEAGDDGDGVGGNRPARRCRADPERRAQVHAHR